MILINSYIEITSEDSAESLYEIEIKEDPIFSFKIIRKSSGISVLDSSLPGLIFSDQFLQVKKGTKRFSFTALGF